MVKEDLTIYCDGSCAVHTTKTGKYAVVAVKNDEVIYEYSETLYNTTNSETEVTGLLRALEYAFKQPKETKVLIRCDSTYAVKGYNIWSHNWEKRGWKRGKSDLLHKNLWQQIHKFRAFNVKVEWVKGHNGDKWNEYCDELTR